MSNSVTAKIKKGIKIDLVDAASPQFTQYLKEEL